ncbi:hypothetical protein C9F11_27510 [Streptomyces sp. YIM 121038]|uniref:hypothetical protein n=1 Tax=Streptomyces sp. YIM 121038 TaxID=2136401 RepID=UPI0011101515|nr:hypothetical protein [Streptomyces sp. YIM 121038]QCX79104.1 hypothetical protein C9F11_27510 [Streptomyces sp. YIM 121038]
MRHREPPQTAPGFLAPHIPADAYRRAQTNGQPIIVVHPVPVASRRPAGAYLIPLVVVTAGGIGAMGLVVFFLALLDIAAHTATVVAGAAGPIGVGGITFKLTRSKSK